MIWVICVISYLFVGCAVTVLHVALDKDYHYVHSSDPMLVFIMGIWWPITLIMTVGNCVGEAEIKAAMKFRDKANEKKHSDKTEL